VTRVDAHQHFWRLERGDYGWLTPDAGLLYRDFEPEDLIDELTACGVHATVLVQAAATEAETHFLLDLAHRYPVVAGVVGWVDFEADDISDRVRSLVEAGRGKLKAFRPMVQDLSDPQWLGRTSLDAAFDALLENDLAFDALVKPQHLAVLRQRLQKHPQLKAVIDHAGKPDIASGTLRQWAAQLEELARTTSVYCKLSGLLTEARPHASVEDLDSVVANIFTCFGGDRVLWGSDWPVVTLRTSYRHWYDIALELVRRHAPGCEEAVFSTNAVRLYGLDIRGEVK
jgi:L-fuconolactonase